MNYFLSIVAAVLLTLFSTQTLTLAADPFVAGTEGYHTFRIPAIIRTAKGTLLAFCEGRKSGRGDAGNIDLVLKRSNDLGKTWSDLQVVWNDGNNTCGNPCPVVDQSTGTVWLLLTWNLGSDTESQIMAGKSKSPRLVYVSHSTDDGKSWTAPKNISETTRLPHWRWYATGPGNAIQLQHGKHAGRLLIPCNHSDHRDPKLHPHHSHAIFSDDHGKTWQIGGLHPDRTNESVVVERDDGTIVQIMRSYFGKQGRPIATSSDGGSSWQPISLATELDSPVCQANAIRYQLAGGKSVFLFCSPQGRQRKNLTIWSSEDGGQTWPTSKSVYSGGAAYSNLVALPDNQVGVLFEKDDYKTISFQVFPVSDFLKPAK